MIKKLLLVALLLLVAIQFFKPEKNISADNTYDIRNSYEVPEEVHQILVTACNDCHTNNTRYPWYANIQPIAWILAEHVEDGKKHLNLSTFTKMPIAVQNHKLEETAEMVEEKEMPLASYTYLGLHADAKLSDAQREILVNWAHAQMDSLKAHYPADSLVMKRRPNDNQ